MKKHKLPWLKAFLPLAILWLACPNVKAESPTFTVNTTADTIDARPGDGTCADSNGKCSLRAAVMEANALNAPAVISIPAGTYKLTRTSRVTEQGDDLDIKSNVTLKGAGAGKTILDGNATYRVLHIYEGTTVRVEGVTIQNGYRGIYNAGTLTLANSTVSGNRVDGSGGGIYNEYGASLTLTNSTVSGNTANYGGGILNTGGILPFADSTVGTLTLTNSTVSGNTANTSGGGIYSDDYATLTLTNSTVSGNKAKYGGGVFVEESIANLSFSTLTLNGATGKDSAGGGIYIASGTVKLKGVILAGNTSESGSGPECSGSLTSGGYNLIGSNADCELIAQKTDILGKGPALGPLAAGGGPTQIHLPQANSPVLDKVPSKDCTDLKGNSLTTDQRGVKRPQGAACDIGAVERKPSE